MQIHFIKGTVHLQTLIFMMCVPELMTFESSNSDTEVLAF